MVVVRRAGLHLVPLEALVEVVLGGEAELDEEGQRAVDGGLADVLFPISELVGDVVGREVAGGLEEHLGDRLTLVGEGQLALA